MSRWLMSSDPWQRWRMRWALSVSNHGRSTRPLSNNSSLTLVNLTPREYTTLSLFSSWVLTRGQNVQTTKCGDSESKEIPSGRFSRRFNINLLKYHYHNAWTNKHSLAIFGIQLNIKYWLTMTSLMKLSAFYSFNFSMMILIEFIFVWASVWKL